RFHRQHPAPAGAGIPGVIAQALNEFINKKRKKDSGHNAQLKQRAKPPTPFFGRDFGYVHRANHRRSANAQATEKSRDEEFAESARDSREDAGDRIEEGAEEEQFLATETVAEEPGAHGAGDAAQDRAGTRHAFLNRRQQEMAFEIGI